MEGRRQGDGRGFSLVKPRDEIKALRFDNLEPCRGIGDPPLYGGRRARAGQFIPHSSGKDDPSKEAPKELLLGHAGNL